MTDFTKIHLHSPVSFKVVQIDGKILKTSSFTEVLSHFDCLIGSKTNWISSRRSLQFCIERDP